ncbi:site-2 protease family protein [Candidatus Peregrinibacteria bacterium CG10_big_fil_rev_8_21_14_0_10_36_19]|nr:MAG: site-2 protease family protein [Candidatus Peregrinibacteria bacterium CG10_big_fil_rev_8_21_14_0_10_36_19]
MFDLTGFLHFLVAILVVLSVHESAHAVTAYYLGDPTAKLKGRISLNPIRHLDLYGSLIFLLTMRIGWGKPVPVNSENFKKPVRDSALTALAGPMSNFALSFAVAFLWKHTGKFMPEILLTQLQTIFHVSIFLGVFNLLPFPPLDGSKILGLFIPRKYEYQYANYLENGVQYFIAIMMIDVLVLSNFLGYPVFGLVIRKISVIVEGILILGT